MANVKYRFRKDVIERLIDAVSKGASYILACNYAGISPVTFNKWMKKGEEQLEDYDDGIIEKGDEFLEFYMSIRAAEGEAAKGWLTIIDQAATNGDWKAAAWKLEKRYPKEYGKQQITPPDDDKNDQLTDEERTIRILSLYDTARKRIDSKGPGTTDDKGNDAQ